MDNFGIILSTWDEVSHVASEVALEICHAWVFLLVIICWIMSLIKANYNISIINNAILIQ